ncbi:hypothetical protein C8R43DRAFT_1027057 [Mycena crocata]|nr:hypothetical protein C8R43DRAFT_1027057 [Mycena crocata]
MAAPSTDSDGFAALRAYVDSTSALAEKEAKEARSRAEQLTRDIAILNRQLADSATENKRLRDDLISSQRIQALQRQQLETERKAFEKRAKTLEEGWVKLKGEKKALAADLARAANTMPNLTLSAPLVPSYVAIFDFWRVSAGPRLTCVLSVRTRRAALDSSSDDEGELPSRTVKRKTTTASK